ncbi:hypothetical protein [Alkalicoccus chagannorensis]|uniref:hypothetical protein n=1 Tax=Alkalicoccus chagannorensis TaxID=427072 RepID=UPI00047D3C00|nr:hypothetical protein [Alkalicoccus chagannorensis]
MNQRQKTLAIGGTLGLVLLAVFPLLAEMYYLPLYYSLLAGAALYLLYRVKNLPAVHERFYQKWRSIRHWPKQARLIRSIARHLPFFLILPALGQLFANGILPWQLPKAFGFGTVILAAAALSAASGLAANASLKEQEKLFESLKFDKEYEPEQQTS